MPADKPKQKRKQAGLMQSLRRFAAPKIITGAGARRDKKLLEAEQKAVGKKKK